MSSVAAVENVKGAKSVIERFTLQRIIKGAVIFGFFAVVESAAQGIGIVAAYPNVEQRAKVIYGLASNAALGLFYGDRHANIVSAAGYMVYRIAPILSLIGAIWMITQITKMLRGQEDTGRWELFLSGETSAQKATSKTILGTAGGLLIAYVLMSMLVAAVGRSPKLDISFGDSLYYSLAIMSGAAVALGIGAITSQLAATRRRAILYSLIPIIIFFVLRSVGNVVDSLAWLKNLTPFGWIDKLHPFYNQQPIWFLPLALLTLVCIGCAIWLSGKRDMAESFIADSGVAKPRFKLLNSQLGFAFRSTRSVMAGWLTASILLSALIAAIDKTVAKSLSSAGRPFGKVFSKISGNPNAHIEIAYLSAAAYLTVIILMIVITNGLGAAREEESSNRLDNFVSGTVSRRRWLSARLLLLASWVLAINMLSSLVIWTLAEIQGIHVSFTTMVFAGLNVLGPVFFLLGVGVLLYGIKPRLAVITMYALTVWSFTIDIVASALKTSKYLADTSLFHNMSLVPAANPKWGTFAILAIAGTVMTYLGITVFQKRDLEAE